VGIPGRYYLLGVAKTPSDDMASLEDAESVWWGEGEDGQAPSELSGEGKGCRWVDGISVVPSPFPLSSQCPLPHTPRFLFWERKW